MESISNTPKLMKYIGWILMEIVIKSICYEIIAYELNGDKIDTVIWNADGV